MKTHIPFDDADHFTEFLIKNEISLDIFLETEIISYKVAGHGTYVLNLDFISYKDTNLSETSTINLVNLILKYGSLENAYINSY